MADTMPAPKGDLYNFEQMRACLINQLIISFSESCLTDNDKTQFIEFDDLSNMDAGCPVHHFQIKLRDNTDRNKTETVILADYKRYNYPYREDEGVKALTALYYAGERYRKLWSEPVNKTQEGQTPYIFIHGADSQIKKRMLWVRRVTTSPVTSDVGEVRLAGKTLSSSEYPAPAPNDTVIERWFIDDESLEEELKDPELLLDFLYGEGKWKIAHLGGEDAPMLAQTDMMAWRETLP